MKCDFCSVEKDDCLEMVDVHDDSRKSIICPACIHALGGE
jgi:hypothetical protein